MKMLMRRVSARSDSGGPASPSGGVEKELAGGREGSELLGGTLGSSGIGSPASELADEEKKEMVCAFSLVWDEMEEGGEEGSSRVASSFLRCIAPEAKLIKVSLFTSAYTEDASAQGPSRLDGRAGSGFVELSSSSTRSSRASFDLFDTMGLPSPLSRLTAQDPHLSSSTLHLPRTLLPLQKLREGFLEDARSTLSKRGAASPSSLKLNPFLPLD